MRRDLERECTVRLRRHLAAGGEETLHSAYELGREALEGGVGVLDIGAALLHAALAALPQDTTPERREAAARALETFMLEALSPFEMAHRGARDANQALRRMEEVREGEIRRVAHELHDSAGQLLASVHLALDELAGDLMPQARPRLERAQVLLVRVEEQLRRLSHEFRPPMLDDLGLCPALAHLAESLSRRTRLEIAVENALDERLPPPMETALYRIVQEGLSNVVRHSRATRCVIRFRSTEEAVTCTIEDDGIGFDPVARAAGAAGLGLLGIRERAAGIGGVLEVRPREGGGAVLAVTVPLEVPHALARADRG